MLQLVITALIWQAAEAHPPLHECGHAALTLAHRGGECCRKLFVAFLVAFPVGPRRLPFTWA
jgi:hypothetical protein